MDFPPTTGLLSGLDRHLTEDEIRQFGDALASFPLSIEGHPVRTPGERIRDSFARETLVPLQIANAFQELLARLYKVVKGAPNGLVTCCTYHRAQVQAAGTKMRLDDPSWIYAFLDALAVAARDLHGQITVAPSPEAKNRTLSRMMPLSKFVEIYAGKSYNKVIRREYLEMLSPELPTASRSRARLNDLGPWEGSIGGYPGPTNRVAMLQKIYTIWCPAVTPFSVYTDKINPDNRKSSPDDTLKSLGIPFKKDQYWIELVYASLDACLKTYPDRNPVLAIPTRIEAAGQWAFWPDRDTPPLVNHALHLATEERGLPEILHSQIDISHLRDAIAWSSPTSTGWWEPTSRMAA